MQQARILIVEDDENIVMALEDDLNLEGYRVTSANDGRQGLQMAAEGGYDLIILDVMLPEKSGLEVCQELRRMGKPTPILMLTAKSLEVDKIVGLELGADDYMTKPFSPRELLARVKAVLRRTTQTQTFGDRYSFDDVELNFKTYEARKGKEPVYFTALEYSLLRLFIQKRGAVLSRDQILDEVWGKDVFISPRSVDTHMAHLRKKLENDPANPKYFVGVRGVGYKFTQ